MKQITLTSKDLAAQMVSSYKLMKQGFKTQEEHYHFCDAIRWIVGQEMSEEICKMAKESLNEN